MKPHEKILKMIEEVDPNDTATMEEIDYKIELYITGIETIRDESGRRIYILHKGTNYESKCYVKEPPEYTRSFDAIHSIASTDFVYNIEFVKDGWGFVVILEYQQSITVRRLR